MDLSGSSQHVCKLVYDYARLGTLGFLGMCLLTIKPKIIHNETSHK